AAFTSNGHCASPGTLLSRMSHREHPESLCLDLFLALMFDLAFKFINGACCTAKTKQISFVLEHLVQHFIIKQGMPEFILIIFPVSRDEIPIMARDNF